MHLDQGNFPSPAKKTRQGLMCEGGAEKGGLGRGRQASLAFLELLLFQRTKGMFTGKKVFFSEEKGRRERNIDHLER